MPESLVQISYEPTYILAEDLAVPARDRYAPETHRMECFPHDLGKSVSDRRLLGCTID